MAIKSPRQERLAYAKDLVLTNPNISKRGLQNAIKSRYGVGLSDTTRRSILQTANTPGVLRSRIATRAFSMQERKELREFLKKDNPPYLKDVVNARYSDYRQRGEAARAAGLSFAEFVRDFRMITKKEAAARGQLITKTTPLGRERGRRAGQIDIFKLLKDARDNSIEQGDYKPIETKKPKTDKGDIKSQKQRYQEKQSSKSSERERERIKTQIDIVDIKLREAAGEVRRHLEEQKINLRRQISNLR